MKFCGSFFSEPGNLTRLGFYLGLAICLITPVIILFFRNRDRNATLKKEGDVSQGGYDLAFGGMKNGIRPSIPRAYIFNQRNLDANRENLASLKEEFEKSRDQFTLLISAALNQNEEEEPNVLLEQMKRLESDYSRIEQKLEIMHTRLVSEDDLLKANRKIMEREQELLEARQVIQSLQEELEISEQERRAQAPIQAQAESLRELAALRNQVWQDENKRNQLDSSLADLRTSYHQLENERHELQVRLQKTEEHVNELENTLAAEKTSKEQATNEAQATATEMALLTDLIKEKELQIEFIQLQLDQRVKKYHELESSHKDLTGEFEKSKEQVHSQEDKVASLETDLVNLKKELTEYSSQVQALKEEGEKRQAAFEAKVRHISYQDEKLNELIQINHRLQETVNEQQARIEGDQFKLDELKNAIEAKQETLARIYAELGMAIHEKSFSEAPGIGNFRRTIIKEWEI